MAEKPEDFNMPSNVVAKIIKEALPSSVQVSPDVRSAASRSASIFILYLTTCANNIAVSNKRKTLSAQDIIDAIHQIGFEEFVEDLIEFHNTYRRDRDRKERQRIQRLNDSNKSVTDKSAEQMEDNEEVEDESESDD